MAVQRAVVLALQRVQRHACIQTVSKVAALRATPIIVSSVINMCQHTSTVLNS
eukprot:COSAG05_NODE_768_length_7455_cov_4.609027_1_plen_53_part_00